MTDVEADLAALGERLRRSTVAVHAARGAAGAGVVWADGAIVTNAHVATSRRVEIVFHSGDAARGEVTQRDERHDLALVRADAGPATPAEVRDAGDLRAGELLVAFGHPLGVPNVLTTGVAYAGGAASGRFVRAALRLAPGNSGGPLADVRGRVVGINSMVAGGIAFAVPSGRVRAFLESAGGVRAGVSVARAVTADGRPAYVVVAVDRGGRADAAGILPGDVLAPSALEALCGGGAFDVLRGGVPRRIEVRAAA